MLLPYDNIFVIDEVQLVGNKIYYTGEGFNASLAEMKVVTGCFKLPIFTSSSSTVTFGDIKAFPNPTTDYMTINNLDQSVFTHLEVTNMEGKVITSQKIKQDSITIDLSGKQTGMYIISLRGKGMTLNKKIIKTE